MMSKFDLPPDADELMLSAINLAVVLLVEREYDLGAGQVVLKLREERFQHVLVKAKPDMERILDVLNHASDDWLHGFAAAYLSVVFNEACREKIENLGDMLGWMQDTQH
jgi:hypothetical protein